MLADNSKLDDAVLDDLISDTPYPNDAASEYSEYTFLNIPFINSTTLEDLFSKKFSFDFDNPPPNPYEEKRKLGGGNFAEGIRAACEKFITECENSDEPKLDVALWLDYHNRVLRMKQIMKQIAPSAYLTNIGLLNTDA